MKFYGRENEICELRKIRQLSKAGSRMTVLTGRRRIGKTELVDKALNGDLTQKPEKSFVRVRMPTDS